MRNPPTVFGDLLELDVTSEAFATAVIAGAIGAAVGYATFLLVMFVLRRAVLATSGKGDDAIVRRIKWPAMWSFVAIGVTLAAQTSSTLYSAWQPLAQFLRPALFGWLAFAFVRGVSAALEAQLDDDKDAIDNRSRRTRIAVLSRIAIVAIVVLTAGLMLFSIPSVRLIGTTMLASAGLAALAVGAAAQPMLRSLISGLQVVMTEPMRIGDLVQVDGQGGRVEEIQLSYVTVRTWDERVIIVPTHRFLDESFENWTRSNEQLTGTVFLNLDPIAEVAPIRAEFERYINGHPLYDHRSAALLVTEAHPESVELRMTISAQTIANLWDLRCDLREHMLKWLRENHPEVLIRHRLEVEAANERGRL